MTNDEEHLRLLGIFHFVLAGLTGLFSLFPIIYLVLGIGFITGTFEVSDDEAVPAMLMGWVFVAIAVVFILLGMALALSMALAGRAIRRRENYTFCVIVAALSCMLMPFGTVLGVLTIVVLMRPSVKEMFGRAGT